MATNRIHPPTDSHNHYPKVVKLLSEYIDEQIEDGASCGDQFQVEVQIFHQEWCDYMKADPGYCNCDAVVKKVRVPKATDN